MIARLFVKNYPGGKWQVQLPKSQEAPSGQSRGVQSSEAEGIESPPESNELVSDDSELDRSSKNLN